MSNKVRFSPIKVGSSEGFTLLEAIVSLAIFSMISLSLVSLVNVGINNYQGVESVTVEQRILKNAVARLVSEARPDLTTGEYLSEDYVVSWIASPVEPSRPALFASGFPSSYRMTLLSVELTLRDSSGDEIRKENVRIAGYQRIASTSPL